MITIQRDESKVRVWIEEGPLNTKYAFTFECGNDRYAALLTEHFQNKLDKAIEKIRKDEYEAGWKDAKQRKPKRNWFYLSLKSSPY